MRKRETFTFINANIIFRCQSPQPNPAGLWTILEPRDQEIGEFEVLAQDFEAPKLRKGRSGTEDNERKPFSFFVC